MHRTPAAVKYSALVLALLSLPAWATEVEVTVANGTKTLAAALSDEGKTLGLADDLVKLGSGTLDLGSNPGYTGNIHVREGVVYATQNDAFGTGAGWTKVYDGAQIQTYTNVLKTLSFSNEKFFIEGKGPDNNGAIWCRSTSDQNSSVRPLGNGITLTGDALITDTKRHDIFGTTDLGGHTLTLAGSGSTFSFENSTTTNGNVVMSGARGVFPTQCKFAGDATSVLTMTNNATFYMCWSRLENAVWTLDMAQASFQLSKDGQDNQWNGPVRLAKMTKVTANGDAETYATLRFPKKVTGDGGLVFDGNYQELRIGGRDNDFKGGVTMKNGRIRVDADGALPRDGGWLHLTNSVVKFNGALSCALPPVEFSGTGYVAACSGTWKDTVLKTGDGELLYESNLGADLLDVRGGKIRFTPKTLQPGLYYGSVKYSDTAGAYTAFSTPLLATNSITLNMPMMEKAGWSAYVLVTYCGYIWNTNSVDTTWTWHCCIDDACDVWIDGERVIQQKGWTTIITKNITLSPGPHSFMVRAYNGDGGSGASNANGAWKDSNGNNCNTKGLAVDRQARGETSNSDYYTTLCDPGDGTLFTCAANLPAFATMRFAPGTGIDFGGYGYELAHLVGFPSVTNGNLTVTGDWTVDGALLKGGACARSSGKVAFAPGATFAVDDVRWGTDGANGLPLLVAEGGIEGEPSLIGQSRYGRHLVKSADGKSLMFYASSGCVIIFR